MSTRSEKSSSRLHKLLFQTPLFAGLTQPQLEELIAASHLVELPAHASLFRAGETIRLAHVLFNGTVKRTVALANGTHKVIELVQAQQMLSLGELFSASRYHSSAEAVGPCSLIAIDIRKLQGILRHSPAMSEHIIEALAKRQCAIEFDVAGYHYSLTGTQRLLDYLIELAGDRIAKVGETTITLKASKKVIASRIGMTPESFSRNLRMLTDSGILVAEGRNIHIQNAALLNPELAKGNPAAIFSRKPKSTGSRTGKPLPPGTLINLCGRQRMLSQRLAISWGMAGMNIHPSRARAKLRQSENEFARNLQRLSSSGLPVELSEKLAALEEIWPHYRKALFDTEPALPHAGTLLELSEETLAAADQMTRQAETLANRPEARYVNIAGRNRMLSQRIAKLFLFREWGLAGREIAERLEPSFLEFERNLAELRQGKMPNPELAAQMDIVAEHWQKLQGSLAPGLRQNTGIQHAQMVLGISDSLLRHVDTAVRLYERLAN